MPTDDHRARTSLEAWIAEVLDTAWERDALAFAVSRLAEVVRDRCGLSAVIDLLDEPDAGMDGSDADSGGTDAVMLSVAGEAVARIGLPPALSSESRTEVEQLTHLAGRVLTEVQQRWTTGVLDDIWTLLADPDDPPEALPTALETLRAATAVDRIGLLEFRGGSFVAYAVAGDPDAVPLDGPIAGPLDADSLSGEAYFHGEAFYVRNRHADRPDLHGPPDGSRLAAVAVLPVPQEPHAHLQLVAGHARPRAWPHVDRTLLRGAGRALRLYLERHRQSDLLPRILEVERTLLSRVDVDPMQLISEALVDIVPGAEAGTILVRDGTTFRFGGISGYEREGLSNATFEPDELRRWYEDGRPDGTQARLLRSSDGIEAASLRAAGPKLGSAGELPRILANLTMPIEYGGGWGALVNLDAFATEHAFLDEDRRLLEAFAPIIAFSLYEADTRLELRRVATNDELTGLPNRRAFDETFQQEMKRAERSRAALSVVILDLDNFKRLNDEHGHEAGDRGLRSVAGALRATARESDHVFRWGGDEFSLLLPDTDRAGADRMVTRLVDAVGNVDTPGPRLGASAGVAVHVPGDGTDEDGLLRRADAEMYAAKRRSGA